MLARLASVSATHGEEYGVGPPRRRALRLLDVGAILMLAAYAANGRASVPFHGDEATFLWLSRDAETLLARDADALAFDAASGPSQAQWLRVLNGSLAPLAIGLTWRGAGRSVRDLNGPWQWHVPDSDPLAQWRVNVARGNRPDAASLGLARLPSALATAASVALVYVLALALSGRRGAALLAAACFATTPAVLLNGRRAMQEGLFLLGTTLVVWVAYRTIRAQGRPSAETGWLIALGAASGLALAAKHSAAVVVAAVLLAGLAAPWLRGHSARHTLPVHFASLAGVALIAVAVFTLLVPVWWSLPRTLALTGLAALAFALRETRTRRTWRLSATAAALIAGAWLARPALPAETLALSSGLLEARRSLIERQISTFAGDDSARRRVTLLLREAFVAGPQYFEDPAWARFPEIQAQIEAYERSPWRGRGGGLAWGIPLAALAASGGAAAWRRRRDPALVLLAAWLALPAFALLANPLPWQRYYLVLHAPLAVLAGLGAAGWLRAASASMRSSRRIPKRVPGRSGSSPISSTGW